MRTLQLSTSSGKGKVVDIEYSSMSNRIMVSLDDFAYGLNDVERSITYFLDPKHYKKLASYKSVSALVKYAKANQITDSASNAHSGSDIASVTSCPVPVPTPAKSLEQVQDIPFYRWTSLAETVDEDALWPYCPFCNEHTDIDQFNHNCGACNFCVDEVQRELEPFCDCGSTFYRDDLGSCYDCFFPTDSRGE